MRTIKFRGKIIFPVSLALVAVVILLNILTGIRFVSLSGSLTGLNAELTESLAVRSNILLSMIIVTGILEIVLVIVLLWALKRAVAASKAKSAFLSKMTHEMRTVLNAITGMTSIAGSARDLESKDYAIGRIHGATEHLRDIFADVQDISKIEADKLEIEKAPFDFEEMLQKVSDLINLRATAKQQKFSVYFDHTIPAALTGDEKRLSQILKNLLGNAVKYTQENGSINLKAHIKKEEHGVYTIQFDISDTGPGISAERQAALFNTFAQAKSGGTGLGLTVSKRIAELMGGSLWMSSEPGKGSVFSFTVKTEKASLNRRAAAQRNDMHHKWVLLVDDEKDVQDYFIEITSRLGVQCDTAGSCEAAVKLLEKGNTYDLFFIDWHMPGGHGIELLRHLRQGGKAPSVVIMLTLAEWGEVESNDELAGADFLQKPIFPSVVNDYISKRLGSVLIDEAHIAEGGEHEHLKGRRILIAEDVESNREIMAALLGATGVEIECAENGAEALRMFTEDPGRYDLIFMDIQMPEMNGLEAARRIRASGAQGAKEIPIVALSAGVFKEDVKMSLKAGMNAHIGKPLDFNEVLDILRRYLEKT